jgi:hypothetical protein
VAFIARAVRSSLAAADQHLHVDCQRSVGGFAKKIAPNFLTDGAPYPFWKADVFLAA